MAKDVPLLNGALPLMAAMRLGHALGRSAKTVEILTRMLFRDTGIPRVLRRYQPSTNDVFIATFAKSGTNWSMQIATQIAYRGQAEFDHIHDLVPWPEAPFPNLVPLNDPRAHSLSPTGRRVIKTHLKATSLPDSGRPRFITVLRDPKEVLVSSYYFVMGMFGLLEAVSFDSWYQMFTGGGPMATRWVEHTASFWARRNRPNALVLSYKHMKADLPGTVHRFAELMDVTLNDQEYAEVVQRAGFEYMKAREAKFAPPQVPLRVSGPMPEMIRRGKSGKSEELLDRRRQVEVDRLSRAWLKAQGCDLPYDELFDAVDR